MLPIGAWQQAMASEPRIDPSVYIAPTATVVGDVVIARDASIWFGVVVRGDAAPISIDEGSNVQDNAVIHVDTGVPTRIGKRVTIGHGAIVHGATVGDDVLIGIGAIVLSGSKIGDHSIIAAGAIVPEGRVIPPQSLVMGVPARVLRTLDAGDLARIEEGSRNYIERARNYRKGIIR